jgi:hypothetical protein
MELKVGAVWASAAPEQEHRQEKEESRIRKSAKT